MTEDKSTARRVVTAASHRPRRGRNTSRFFFESLLIVLSVLLGLAISEWRQGRADRELGAAVLENCRLELTDNLATLESALPVHRSVQAELRAILAREGKTPGLISLMREVMPERGLQLPALKEVAWQTAISTGAIRHLEFEQASRLAEVYVTQRSGLATTVDRFGDRLFSHRSFAEDGTQETVQMIGLFFVELTGQEEYLIGTYRELLSELER